jgi:hypothetical protein
MMTAYLAKHPDQTFGGYVSVSTSCGGPGAHGQQRQLAPGNGARAGHLRNSGHRPTSVRRGQKKLPETMQRYTVVQVAGVAQLPWLQKPN